MHTRRTVLALLAACWMGATAARGGGLVARTGLDCQEQCGVQAEQARAACEAGGGDAATCTAVGQDTFAACASECPTEVGSCEERCEQVADTVTELCIAACEEAGRRHCDDRCADKRATTLERCLTAVCADDGESGEDGGGCEDHCAGAGRALFAACLDAAGRDAADVCEEEAHAAVESCIDAECADDGETEDECDERCTQRGVEVVAHCTEDGRLEEVCEALGGSVVQRCRDEECVVPGPTCADLCQAEAEAQFYACMADGGDAATCAAEQQTARDECVATTCEGDEECATRCDDAAQARAEACVDGGEAAERCELRATEAARHCADEHCGIPDETGDDGARCETQCDDHADETLRRCIAEGGVADDCTTSAADAYAACVELHCTVDDSCRTKCSRRTDKLVKRCVRRGGDPDACEAERDTLQATCESDRCTPPPPGGCTTGCATTADAAEAACLDAGGDESTCRGAGTGAREACLGSCGAAPPPTCEQDCEAEAVRVRAAAAARHLSPAKVARRARKAFRTCAAHCDDTRP